MVLAHPAPRVNVATSPPGAVAEALVERAHALSTALTTLATESDRIADAAKFIVAALVSGHKVLVCGNGGSAAETQHFVGELVGRFRRERDPWPALALTADTAVLTAIANDYGFERIFARQVAAFGGSGDLLVGLSTSGNSPNVVNAAAEARVLGMRVVALTGQRPSRLGTLADAEIAVPASETALVQEVHSVLVHLICEIVESHLTALQGHDEEAVRP
jgi:D-sedoheptulose 7-phosphate isomerase